MKALLRDDVKTLFTAVNEWYRQDEKDRDMCCVHCFATCSVDLELEPTPLCHSCAHDAVDMLREFVQMSAADFVEKIEKLQRYGAQGEMILRSDVLRIVRPESETVAELSLRLANLRAEIKGSPLVNIISDKWQQPTDSLSSLVSEIKRHAEKVVISSGVLDRQGYPCGTYHWHEADQRWVHSKGCHVMSTSFFVDAVTKYGKDLFKTDLQE